MLESSKILQVQQKWAAVPMESNYEYIPFSQCISPLGAFFLTLMSNFRSSTQSSILLSGPQFSASTCRPQSFPQYQFVILKSSSKDALQPQLRQALYTLIISRKPKHSFLSSMNKVYHFWPNCKIDKFDIINKQNYVWFDCYLNKTEVKISVY